MAGSVAYCAVEVIQKISEDDMIAEFLRAEINSTRFSLKIAEALADQGIDRSIIDFPDTSDVGENKVRRGILQYARSYGENDSLFHGFPYDLDWHRATFSAHELADVRYVVFSYWIELTQGSLRARDAIDTITAGIEVFGVSNETFHTVAADYIRGVSLPELILVGTGPTDLVVLEGHLRLTSYLLAGPKAPDTLTCIVGFSPNLPQWKLYSYESYDKLREKS